jgi:hypothetical protein
MKALDNSKESKVPTKQDEAICFYTTIFGVLIYLGSFFQVLIIGRFHAVPLFMLAVHVITIISFIYLGKQKHHSIWLLIISGLFQAIVLLLFLYSGLFSLLSFVALTYIAIVIVMVYMHEIPEKLVNKWKHEKKEDEAWRERLA